MNCPQCSAVVADNITVCPACGTRVSVPEQATEVAEQLATGRLSDTADDDNRVEGPWHYSGKAMRGAFLGAGLVTVAFLALGGLLEYLGWMPAAGRWHLLVWGVLLAIPAALWLYQFGVLLYRTKTIRYSLTPHRFFHEEGLLIPRKHVIEILDIDDMEQSQSLWERFVCGNVGTITIYSSDPGTPVLVVRGLEHHDEVFRKIDDARQKQRSKRGLKAI
jgi:membrane protein YdbS with pleckstrin-like domain